MDIKYIGIPNANIEGRYNDIKYFIEKIVSLEDKFSTNLHIKKVFYNDTEEFDNISIIPYEKGLVFEINNTEDQTKYSNNTEAKLIVSDDKVYFIITKADWNNNRNAEVENKALENTKQAKELITTLGKTLQTNRLESYEKSKEWLIKFAAQRQEKIQKEKYTSITSVMFNKLKEALKLFESDKTLKELNISQEKEKQSSDRKEQYKKQLDAIPEEEMEVIYQYSIGKIDQITAIRNIKAIKEQKQQPKVTDEQVKDMIYYAMLDYNDTLKEENKEE